MNHNQKETTLSNMLEAQKKLAEAISKFADAELLKAKAHENNSLAYLNYSKIMREDQELIKKILESMEPLDSHPE